MENLPPYDQGSEQPTVDTEPVKIVILDQSEDAMAAARDQANTIQAEELTKGGRFRQFINGIWKGGQFKEFHNKLYVKSAMEEIKSSGDVNLFQGDNDARARAMQSTIERFQNDSEGELIHTDAGEKKEQFSNSELAVGVKDLVRRYCTGELNDETLEEEKTRFLIEYRKNNGTENLGRGIVTVDNLLDIAKAVAGKAENEESLDNILANAKVITGETRTGVRTEVHHSKVDKVVDYISKSRIGSVVDPITLSIALSFAASLSSFGSQRVLGAVTKTLLPGATSGIWAGLRENKRMKDDYAQYSRETAQGKESADTNKRRAELEKARYGTLSAVDLANTLRSTIDKDILDNGGKDALKAALDALCAAETRINLSDSRHIDLITFTNPLTIGDERMALDLARAEVKVALNNRLSDDVRRELGLDESANLQTIIDRQSKDYLEFVEDDISSKDKIFKRIKMSHVAKSAAMGVLTGVGIGLLFQEGLAAVDSTRTGLLEQLWGAHNNPINGVEHQTILSSLFSGDKSTIHTGANSDILNQYFGKGEVGLSSESQLINNHDGTFDIIGHNGNIMADNIPINSDGTMPQSSINQLIALGMNVEDKSFTTDIISQQTKIINSSDFVKDHLAETTHVTRAGWFDNNTTGIYDKNELGLHWGANNGITDHGFQMSVSTMTHDGSFHDGLSVDYMDAIKDGDLKLAVSGTVGTQNQVFMLDIGLDGKVDIPADSPAAHFFVNENGQTHFIGGFAEAVHVSEVDANGVTHMMPLATVIGEKVPTLTEEVTIITPELHPIYEIITPGYDTITDKFTEMAPFAPLESRRSMEAANARTNPEVPQPSPAGEYSYRGNEALTPMEIEQLRKETSPRLKDNSDADLIPAEEFDFYKHLLIEQNGQEYVDEIEGIVNNSPELNGLSNETKIIVTIPVNAAGKSESNNIYNVLTKGYGSQDPEGLSSATILLHVNWFDTYDKDESIMIENIAKTRSEIKRAKEELSHTVNIAVIETEYKRADVQGGVIGYVARKMNDVALLALDLAASSGRMDKDHDVLLIRNDADVIGIRRHYLKRYKDEFESNKEPDVFMGTTSFDQTKAKRAPGLVLSGNFMQSFDIIANSREGGVHTGGANFGIKASILAAVGSMGFDSFTGAGSDDSRIGQRIKQARRGDLSNPRNKNEYGAKDYPANQISGNEKPKRRVGMAVHGARIDTNSDRGESNYVDGRPFARQWSGGSEGFSANGYKPRDKDVNGDYTESLIANSEPTIENIRRDFEGTINTMYASSAVTRSALAFTFPKSSYYELTGTTPNCKFKITPDGAEYLKKRLIARDDKGRFAKSYGRKKREWYGDNGARQSTMIKI